MAFDWLYAKNPLIIYIADPMCSWCYGFAPAIAQIKAAYPTFEFRTVMGGLRPGGTDNLADMGEFLAEHWNEVHERTNQPFNHGIIGDRNFILDTEPGCRAVVAARHLGLKVDLAFFHSVQKAFFVDNSSMINTETFANLAEQAGLNKEDFIQAFESEEIKYDTRAEFQLSSEMGISGFPSVVIRHKEELFLASNGYRSFEDLNAVFQNIINS
ncbi:MAG: DsbA family protein [Salibacteraceae bacterium]|nr:DsbA family protein [Salibacteraceae bacterium]